MIVKIVQRKADVTLIEWQEGSMRQRALVPSADVMPDGYCEYPERGIPHGVDWADYVEVNVTPEDIQASLHNAGIWTVEDLMSRPREAQGAVNAAFSGVFRELIRQVKHLNGG